MVWQIWKNGEPLEGTFDDGIVGVGPGEEGFTTDLVAAHLKEGETFSYVGVSWPAE